VFACVSVGFWTILSKHCVCACACERECKCVRVCQCVCVRVDLPTCGL